MFDKERVCALGNVCVCLGVPLCERMQVSVCVRVCVSNVGGKVRLTEKNNKLREQLGVVFSGVCVHVCMCGVCECSLEAVCGCSLVKVLAAIVDL